MKRLLSSFMFACFAMATAFAAEVNQAIVNVTVVDADQADIALYDASATQWMSGYNKISGGQVTMAYPGWGANKITYVGVDASSVKGSVLKATLKCEVSGSTDSKRTCNYGVGYNNSVWSSNMTYNDADKSITTMGATVASTSASSTAFNAVSFDVTDAFQDSKVKTLLIYETAAAGGYIKNISVEIEAANSPLDAAKGQALSKVEALPVGTGLFVYNSKDIEAYKNAVNAATTIEAINAIAIPQMSKPEAGKQYMMPNVTAEGTYLGEAKLSETAEPIFFEEATGGYYIKVRDNYLNMAGGNTWSMNATETAGTVWTITATNGEYTIKGPNGLVGTDNKTAGSATYGNKGAGKNERWLIEPYEASTDPEPETPVVEYNYSIFDSFGTLLAQGSAFDGDNVTCAVNRYVNNEGTLYETAKSGDWYHPSFTVTPENLQFTVTYNATDINNVVFYAECEDLSGATAGTQNSSRTSKGLTGYGQDLPVTSLPEGRYIFNIHAANGNSAARAVQIKANGEVIAELTIAGSNNNQDIAVETVLTAASDITISSEGSNASGIDYLYIIKEETPKAILDFVAKSSVGDISYTGQVTEGDEITETYAFPRYINVDGTLYETSSSDGKGDYQKTFTFNADNLNQVVEYTATDIKPVFFSEGEDLTGASVAGGIPSRTSMTKMGYGTMNVTTLPAGKYQITVNVSNGNSSERKVTFVNGENELAALTFAARANVQIKTTEEITLAEETEINVIAEGSSSAGIDYLYIVKTGDYVAPKDYTITYVIDGVNTTATFTEGTAVTPIADPVKEGYEFKGWVPAIPETLTEDITVTAQFEKIAPATEPMTITVSQIGYNTITPAKNIDIAGSGIKAYIATSASGNTIKLTSVDKLVAGQGYLIAGNASQDYTVTATEEEFDAPAVNYFVGVAETTTIGEATGAYTNCYLSVDKQGENPGFYMVDGQITISAGKAYLSAPIEVVEGQSIVFEIEDEDATIVINAAADAKKINGAFSINGMAVKSAKGIIVKDGKKFIVK